LSLHTRVRKAGPRSRSKCSCFSADFTSARPKGAGAKNSS
jgi:hypothetical protein